MSQFTPTQVRLLTVLSDGLPHSKKELADCLEDDLAGPTALRKHLCLMRKVLRPQGQDIICEVGYRGNRYRHIRLLSSSGEE